jgi:hypothetical protein
MGVLELTLFLTPLPSEKETTRRFVRVLHQSQDQILVRNVLSEPHLLDSGNAKRQTQQQQAVEEYNSAVRAPYDTTSGRDYVKSLRL